MKHPLSSVTIAAGIVISAVFLVFAAIKEHHSIDPAKCTNCAKCVSVCPEEAIFVTKINGKAIHAIDINKCTACGVCVDECEYNAIFIDKTDLTALEKQAKTKKKDDKKKPAKKGSK